MGPRRLRQAVGAHFHVWRGDGRDVAAGMRARRARGLFCIYYYILFVHELQGCEDFELYGYIER